MNYIRTADKWASRPVLKSETAAFASALTLARKLKASGVSGYVRVYAEVGHILIDDLEIK